MFSPLADRRCWWGATASPANFQTQHTPGPPAQQRILILAYCLAGPGLVPHTQVCKGFWCDPTDSQNPDNMQLGMA